MYGLCWSVLLKKPALHVEIGKNMIDTIKQVIDRIRGLKQFVVRVPVPNEFRFTGSVPFDMEIAGNVAMVTVWAADQAEAQARAEEFFQDQQ